jgi:ribonuclease BN (tRNA processing enzyme)
MELTFLGSSNAFAAQGRYWSSFLVERKYQFDAPPTLLPHLKRLGVPLDEIEVVFLTHQHGDHFMGLPFLLLEYVYMTPRTRDLFIVGPPGVGPWMEDFAERCYPNITRDAGYRRVYIDARPRDEQRAGTLTFRAVRMNHVKESMLALGYQVRIGDKTVAYTGDTMFCDEIFELANGADVLVLDCTYSEGSGPEHMGLDDIKIIRKKIPPDTTIILTHLNAEPILNGFDNTLVAGDFVTFRFE